MWLELDSRAAGPPGILVDESHAVMTRAMMGALMEYSTTDPSGVIPGKRWVRYGKPGPYGNGLPKGEDYMGEYVLLDAPDLCTIVWRRILLVD